jgi:hypothetical protein
MVAEKTRNPLLPLGLVQFWTSQYLTGRAEADKMKTFIFTNKIRVHQNEFRNTLLQGGFQLVQRPGRLRTLGVGSLTGVARSYIMPVQFADWRDLLRLGVL